MTITYAFFTGLLQALCEFLPISSSAHLALLPFLTGNPYQGLAYDVALHGATLCALAAYFYKDLIKITSAAFTKPKSGEGKLFWHICVASVPAALAGYFFEDAAENAFRTPPLIATMLILFAVFLLIADKKTKEAQTGNTSNYNLRLLLAIGCAQALAIVPGVSRSGVTITAALLLGLSRTDAAKISFLMSVPIIAGAFALKIKTMPIESVDAAFITGFLTALISGWLVIKFLMKYIRSHNFNIFVVYRLALGAIIIILYFTR
jgi:undecaprenyl-diphosphatase